MTGRLRAAALASALGTAVAAAAVLGTTSPALAHNSIVLTTPADGEVLTALPESFEIRTSDALLDLGGDGRGFALLVQDAAGLYYGDGCVRVSGPSMFATPALGEPGDYTVSWQLVSADGHTLSDSYSFVWEPDSWEPEGENAPAPGSVERPSCGEEPSPAGTEAPDAEGDDPAAAGDASLASEVWWIAGGAGAIAVAVVATLLLTRRRER